MRLAWDIQDRHERAALLLWRPLERRVPAGARRSGIIVSGGNVDLDNLPWNKNNPYLRSRFEQQHGLFSTSGDVTVGKCVRYRPVVSRIDRAIGVCV